ncbi:MAG: ATP-binding protein [Acutalibacteraceae bacterium]
MKSTIKTRWMLNIYFAAVIILLVVSCLVIYLFANRYYHYTQLTLYAQNTDVVDTYFENFKSSTDEQFNKAAKNFVSNFPQRDVMDVWVIDRNGKISASSGDYEIAGDVSMDDYYSALRNENFVSCKKTKMPWGESVMALSCVLKDSSGSSFGAVRYIISLESINRQIAILSVFVFLGFLIVALLFTNSGLYFVSTIVEPVNKISRTAKRIASGDFSARIYTKPYNDEIGQLCDTINDMAKQLGETEKMKNDFISTVSHEIRTPLTAIKGWGETLLTLDESDSQLNKKGLEVITDEAQRLSDMVEELLDFSSLTSGRAKMQKEKIEIRSFVEKALLVYKQKAQSENKTLKLICSDNEKFYVYADADRIFRVFVNILDNALKYTKPSGNITVKVEKNKNYVRILFSDNGCGIAKKDLQYVKQKFYKANNTVHGTGIGLAVADEIIKTHSGKLNISSTEGKGTDVEVLLPLENEEDM